ncbi:uncharacterized protein LOC100901520 [Galendromus occidentalis]|uniref:Uncharacterized protein LOC100901520 n=1 Tax=Galendromus occidentalis TaxID=34638 RepID=A0AAJ6QMM9_9ACAR|nr:uncharacterized protein LOC100901520 [Galendromus occidentalis]
MPKQAVTLKTKLQNYVKLFGCEVFVTDGVVLTYKLCEKAVNTDKKYYVAQHVNSSGHKQRAAREKTSTSEQVSLLTNYVERSDRANEFSADLCRAFVEANIPLYEVMHPSMRSFLEKYTKRTTPHHSTLRKTYLPKLYDQTVAKIRESVGDSNIWVSMDETTDVKGQFVVNTIVGVLDSSKASTAFLLDSQVVEKTNHATIAQAFCSALSLLWPDKVNHERVLLFVSDAAKYMKKAAAGLQILFPKMIYVTCLAHGVHRVCEQIREQFPMVDSFVANAKKVFLKSTTRIQKFRELAPGLALPPRPIVTRWGTWLEAACYYAANFEKIKEVIGSFHPEDAVSIEKCRKLLVDSNLKSQLLYIATHFKGIPNAIKKLECTTQPVETTLSVLGEIASMVNAAPIPSLLKFLYFLKSVSARRLNSFEDTSTRCTPLPINSFRFIFICLSH